MNIDRTSLSSASAAHGQREVRTQFGALCFRRKSGRLEFLLITSRETQRWIVPKGWPMPGTTPVRAAETEAWEEAGVRGRIGQRCLGIYSYTKLVGRRTELPCVVALFPLRVRELAKDFPERRERRRKWFTPEKAAAKVDEPELAQLLLAFDPDSQFG